MSDILTEKQAKTIKLMDEINDLKDKIQDTMNEMGKPMILIEPEKPIINGEFEKIE